MTSIIAQLVLAVLASVIVMWFSRLREFRADAGGARLAGTGKMVAALERLKAGTEPLPDQLVAFGDLRRARRETAPTLLGAPIVRRADRPPQGGESGFVEVPVRTDFPPERGAVDEGH